MGWFLVLLLVCGAGAGYYLYQDNLAKAAGIETAERKLKEKKARGSCGETANKTGTGNQEKKEKGTAGGPEGL